MTQGLTGFNIPILGIGAKPQPLPAPAPTPSQQPPQNQVGTYNFTPTTPGSSAPWGGLVNQGGSYNASLGGMRNIGVYNNIGGSAPAPTDAANGMPTISVQGTAPYKDYQVLGNVAQQYGQQAGNSLNDPRVQQALATQNTSLDQTNQQRLGQASLANLSTGNTRAQGTQGNALGILEAQANGTGGPSAGAQQFQQGIQQAQNAQASMAASARGNAMANAAKNAQSNSANIAQQGNLQSQGIQAQEQLNAQNNFANATNTAAGQYGTAAANYANAANQGQAMYGQNLAGYANNTQAQQGAAEQYYLGQQNALMQQQQLAGNMATGIGNLNVGQAAQASQMGIAQNQINNQYLGAGLQAGSAIFDSSLQGWGSGSNSGGGNGGGGNSLTSENGGSYFNG